GVAAEVDVDVAALDALDHAGHQLAHAVLPGVHDLLAFGLAHALDDDLLGRLRRDAAEIDVLDLLLDVVADFHAVGLFHRIHQADLPVGGFHHHVVGHDLPAAEGLVAAVPRVDRHARQHVLVEVALLGRGGEGGLEGLQDHRLRHALFVGDRINDQQQFLAHLLSYSALDGFDAAGLLLDFRAPPVRPLPGRASRPAASLAGP